MVVLCVSQLLLALNYRINRLLEETDTQLPW